MFKFNFKPHNQRRNTFNRQVIQNPIVIKNPIIQKYESLHISSSTTLEKVELLIGGNNLENIEEQQLEEQQHA